MNTPSDGIVKFGEDIVLLSPEQEEQLDDVSMRTIEHIRTNLGLTQEFIKGYLAGFNPADLRAAGRSLPRAVGYIRRAVNDSTLQIDKAALLNNVTTAIEELHSSRLEHVNPEFVEEYIYGVLYRDLPAMRQQITQQHHDAPEPVGMR